MPKHTANQQSLIVSRTQIWHTNFRYLTGCSCTRSRLSKGQSAEADPYLKWTTLGNEFADHAAKTARRTEMPAVLLASDSAAESTALQYNSLLAFSRFLVDVNVAETQKKSELQQPVPAAAERQDIQHASWDYYITWETALPC